MKLTGETVLITGSTSGIGKKTAEILLREGCRVTICSRSSDKVQKTLDEFRKEFGENVQGVVCDVSEPDSVRYAADQTAEKFGSLRVLIANAGISPIYGPFEYLAENQVKDLADRIIDVNLKGTFNSVAAALPYMRKQKYGRIVTLTGGGASRPVRNFTLYSASKGGIAAFSRCLAEELKNTEDDIKINIFQPGPMKTDLNRKLTLVSGWKNQDAFQKQWEKLFDSVDLDIEKCCLRILPLVSPGCRFSGKEIPGFSMIGMLPKLFKVQKLMKSL